MSNLNILPASLNLSLYGGDDSLISLNLKDGTGAPLPVVGTISATLRLNQNDLTSYAFVVTLDPLDDSHFWITLPSEVSAALVVDATQASKWIDDELITAPMFQGKWDLQADNGGDIRTLVYGSILIIGEVTR